MPIDRLRALLLRQWWTPGELAERLHCAEGSARILIRRLAQFELVFCQHRKAAMYHPKEYRVFPRAMAIRAISVQRVPKRKAA